MNLSNQPKNFTLLFFGCLMIAIMVYIIFTGLLFMPYYHSIQEGSFNLFSIPKSKLISAQIVQMICFTIPPILFALFSKNDFLLCYNFDKSFQSKKYLIAAAIALLLFPILINFQYWVTLAPWPESIRASAELEKVMNEKFLGLFLNEPGLGNLIIMILIIGVGAGLTEELFFRGFLMPWIERITKSTFAAIIISSGFFSIFHPSFYNYLPIFLVGILFGYLYSKTRDLKLNIFIHALYNSAQVFLNYLHENKFIKTNLEDVKSIPILIWILCFSIVAFLIYKLVKDYEYLSHTS
jgi:uncharacterized protein